MIKINRHTPRDIIVKLIKKQNTEWVFKGARVPQQDYQPKWRKKPVTIEFYIWENSSSVIRYKLRQSNILKKKMEWDYCH